MARPLRIEFPDALYHVTSRGDRCEAIYEDDKDRLLFLRTLAEVVERFNWLCHAYCLMTNHYHLLVETPDGNLSKGMRQLNGVYTQASNRRHLRTGHLFQGRFKGILVERESHLLELARYIVLNPVRAVMVDRPEDWRWSSYRAMVGQVPTPGWLETDSLLSEFGQARNRARQRYKRFVLDGVGQGSPWTNLRQQLYLGGDGFVERTQAAVRIQGDQLSIPKRQRRGPVPTLAQVSKTHVTRNQAIVTAYATGAYGYREIAAFHGLHLSTVGRIVRTHWMQQSET